MQRVGIGVLAVAVVAAAVWITLGDGSDTGAPASGAADPLDRVVGPPLAFGRPAPAEPEPPAAEAVADPATAAGLDAEETAGDPRSTGVVDPMTGSGGGSSPSGARAERRRAIDAVDGPSAPPDLPADLPPDLPADVPEPVGPPVDPVELADLEAQVAENALRDGLVDPAEADTWAAAQVDPLSPPALQDQQFDQARNEFIATRAMSIDLVKERFGPDLPPNEQTHKTAIGDKILSLQPPEYRAERLKKMLAEDGAT